VPVACNVHPTGTSKSSVSVRYLFTDRIYVDSLDWIVPKSSNTCISRRLALSLSLSLSAFNAKQSNTTCLTPYLLATSLVHTGTGGIGGPQSPSDDTAYHKTALLPFARLRTCRQSHIELEGRLMARQRSAPRSAKRRIIRCTPSILVKSLRNTGNFV
jgi:hypothetical protein